MIAVIISTVGGCGTSTIARDFSKEAKGLLIEASNRTRVQDLLMTEPVDAIEDYMDFLRGKPVADVVIHGDGYDLIQGNIFHDLEEIEEEDFLKAVNPLKDDDIFVDLSRYRESDLIAWAKVADVLYCVMTNRPGSVRAFDRIRFILRKNQCRVLVVPLVNRVKPGDEKAFEGIEDLHLDEAIFFREVEHPVFSLKGGKEKNKRKSFWSIFKRS